MLVVFTNRALRSCTLGHVVSRMTPHQRTVFRDWHDFSWQLVGILRKMRRDGAINLTSLIDMEIAYQEVLRDDEERDDADTGESELPP